VSNYVLQIKNLRVQYHTDRGKVQAVDGVDLNLEPGVRLGLVGESGSGKSTMALALMRMIKPPGRVMADEMLVDGVDVLKLSDEEMRRTRLNTISMIPQGAMNSLNPVLRVRDQILDGMQDHPGVMTQQQREERVREVLESVELRPQVASMYPHELSGGMKQRVCIAIAIAMRPKLIIADEPTSALDVVVQRQVMETINRLQQTLGVSLILIGHDMGLMAQAVDRLAVMYSGRLAELSPVEGVFTEPLHPYTQLLTSSLPSLKAKGTFRGIPGLPPSLLKLPQGCLFHPRCPSATTVCRERAPQLREVRPGRYASCHLYEGGAAPVELVDRVPAQQQSV
jgi:peptide/nickel transport system ATP-binding protein